MRVQVCMSVRERGVRVCVSWTSWVKYMDGCLCDNTMESAENSNLWKMFRVEKARAAGEWHENEFKIKQNQIQMIEKENGTNARVLGDVRKSWSVRFVSMLLSSSLLHLFGATLDGCVFTQTVLLSFASISFVNYDSEAPATILFPLLSLIFDQKGSFARGKKNENKIAYRTSAYRFQRVIFTRHLTWLICAHNVRCQFPIHHITVSHHHMTGRKW